MRKLNCHNDIDFSDIHKVRFIRMKNIFEITNKNLVKIDSQTLNFKIPKTSLLYLVSEIQAQQ